MVKKKSRKILQKLMMIIIVLIAISRLMAIPVSADVVEPNIILIVIDTLRADHLSLHDYERDTSPQLNNFSSTAAVFKNAFSSSTWTIPAYASILMAMQAYNHNQHMHQNPEPNHPLMPDVLKRNGYKTVSIQTNLALENYDSDFDESYHYTHMYANIRDWYAVSKAIDWLGDKKNTDNKFFMFMGLFSPHWPYWPYYNDMNYNAALDTFIRDENFQAMERIDVNDTIITHFKGTGEGLIFYQGLSQSLRDYLGVPVDSVGYYKDGRIYLAAYDATIKTIDSYLGVFFESLRSRGLFENSIIIITADHGENMVDHEMYFAHGFELFNSQTHVPLVIKLPEQQQQIIIEDNVRTFDIFPTIFNYLNLDTDLDIDGKSLLPMINGEEVDLLERPVMSYREYVTGEGWIDVSVIMDGYKLIKQRNQTMHLYDLINDPDEQTDIAALLPETVETLNNYLNHYFPSD